ncbi:MAG: glycerol-3-phosphate responsive antiterminator [Lacticaseibacillus rhamnosus]
MLCRNTTRSENMRGDTKLIAGGFIRSEKNISDIFAAGFWGVTTSDRQLWQYGVNRS